MSIPDYERRLSELRAIDPIGDAKRIGAELGAGPEDQLAVGGLAHRMMWEVEGRKRALLSELCDTYRRMQWDRLPEILLETGFVEISRTVQ